MRSSPPKSLSLSLSLSLADITNAGGRPSRRQAHHRRGLGLLSLLPPVALGDCGEHDRTGQAHVSALSARAHLAVLAGQRRAAA